MITVLGNLPRTVDYHLLYGYIPTAFKQHFMWFFFAVFVIFSTASLN